jgi:hypothetical protein
VQLVRRVQLEFLAHKD